MPFCNNLLLTLFYFFKILTKMKKFKYYLSLMLIHWLTLKLKLIIYYHF